MVILTRNAVRHSIDSIVVALVTRTVRGLPTEVVLGRRQGLPTRCVANLDNILTVPRHHLLGVETFVRARAADGLWRCARLMGMMPANGFRPT